MSAKDLNHQDLERLGHIVERLLQSGKLTDDERWAVDQSCRAAADLVSIRHTEIARAFYARPDMKALHEKSIEQWLVDNRGAQPGTVSLICGRMHVASYDQNGKLGLYPILEL